MAPRAPDCDARPSSSSCPTDAHRPAWTEGRAQARAGHRGRAGDVMAARRAASGGTGKRRARRTGVEAPAPEMTRPPAPERRFVDVDPWALLVEQLTEVPEELP